MRPPESVSIKVRVMYICVFDVSLGFKGPDGANDMFVLLCV